MASYNAKKGITYTVACLILTLTHVNFSFAHSEHDKGRFVSAQGKDEGRCDNRFRPCQSIGYAATQANKGDVVLVAEGNYSLNSKQDLFYVISQIVPVRGGYSTKDHFQTQHPSANPTFISGLPNDYADDLYQKGFSVIGDGKSQLNDEVLQQTQAELASLNESQTQAECQSGRSGTFPCENISLLGHLSVGQLLSGATGGNDVWGHVDLNTGKEYALIGLRNGVAVVDVTEPTLPDVVDTITGQSTTWRDIKVYQRFNRNLSRWQAWAYVTADSANEGLVIIDLNDLENGISVEKRDFTDGSAHNVYISGVDYTLNVATPGSTPQVNILGANNFGGALRSYDLKVPQSPAPAYTPFDLSRSDYTHDASSLEISDARAQRDCPNAMGGQCVVLLDFNEDTLRLWDNTDLSSAEELSDTTYPNAEYSHSGWWSEDRRYVLLHDELDEQRRGLNTTVHVFDISDLTAPQLVASWRGPTRAIDHNGFVRGNRYYMSNYERGLTILDISNPLAPQEVGFFDTFPSSDNGSFNGAWGVYPYLPSGNILVSDIQRGLFILRDETLQDQTHIGFDTASITVNEGENAVLSVSKQGSTAASIQYSVIYGSASSNDIQLTRGEIQWADSETDTRSIEIPITLDARDELSEQFFVTLHTPVGTYLSPSARIATVNIGQDSSVTGQAVFADSQVSVRENQQTVTLNMVRSGGNTGVLRAPVSFAQTNAQTDLSISTNELVWQDGQDQAQSIVVTIVDDTLIESEETFALVSGASTVDIIIRDDESNQAPISNAGNDLSVNARTTVQLRGSASDPENMPVTLLWSQTSGATVSLANNTSDTAQFTAPNAAATLSFELNVTDEFGSTGTDTVTVNVAAPAVETPPVQPTPPPSSDGGGGSTNVGLLLLLLATICGRASLRFRCMFYRYS